MEIRFINAERSSEVPTAYPNPAHEKEFHNNLNVFSTPNSTKRRCVVMDVPLLGEFELKDVIELGFRVFFGELRLQLLPLGLGVV